MKTNLTLIISENCSACTRAKKVLLDIHSKNPNISLDIININSCKDKRIVITPALLINNELFSYGDMDTNILELKLSLFGYETISLSS